VAGALRNCVSVVDATDIQNPQAPRKISNEEQNKERKPVLSFENGVKPMVINRTNFETLEEALGDSDNWPGHKVKIFCAPTSYQGKRVDGLRVEAIVPKPALKDDLNDEIPL
jgi:hypothetical protein